MGTLSVPQATELFHALAPGALDPEVLTAAVDLAMRLPYAAFRGQVLPFLEPEAVELYEGEASWE
jgi:hypothetical protein